MIGEANGPAGRTRGSSGAAHATGICLSQGWRKIRPGSRWICDITETAHSAVTAEACSFRDATQIGRSPITAEACGSRDATQIGRSPVTPEACGSRGAIPTGCSRDTGSSGGADRKSLGLQDGNPHPIRSVYRSS